jgi:hypothetical protein
MSYQISISGHVASKKAEAEVLQKAVDLADELGAEGSFGFAGSHFSVFTGAMGEATARAKEALAEYAESADADDQVDKPTMNTRGEAP